VALGALVQHGGWSCRCVSIRSQAQLKCPCCGEFRSGPYAALGLPVIIDAHFSGAGFRSVYVEARFHDGWGGFAIPLPEEPHEGLEFAAMMFAVAAAMAEAHRDHRRQYPVKQTPTAGVS